MARQYSARDAATDAQEALTKAGLGANSGLRKRLERAQAALAKAERELKKDVDRAKQDSAFAFASLYELLQSIPQKVRKRKGKQLWAAGRNGEGEEEEGEEEGETRKLI